MAVPISLQDEIPTKTAEELRERYDFKNRKIQNKVSVVENETQVNSESILTVEENVDGVTQTLLQTVEQVNTNTGQITANTTAITELELDIGGLTLNQQKAGGANILENSVKIFDNDDNFWTYSVGYDGHTELDTSNETISGRLQYLGNGWENICHGVPNSSITISFYYKKLEASIASIKVNDSDEVTLGSESEWTLYEEHTTISNGLINLKFTCDTLNGYVYRDLMINFGNVAIPWTQSLNETITETVKIGGAAVEVISDASETKTKMSATSGFQVLDKITGEEITVFDREGMETKRGKFSTGVEVGKMRITPISNTLIGFSIND